MSGACVRLAVWSGPRNISTALMRSWGNRADTAVCDEPLYAHYLAATRKPHPGIDEVVAAGETDWRRVVDGLTGPVSGGKSIYYQKHMTHHLLPGVGRDWLAGVTNAFLIRHPREVLISYAKVVAEPAFEDTGFPQQAEIFDWVHSRGATPPVIDARDVLADPRRTLGLLCDALGVPFDDAMLRWPAGPRATDGVWAKYWYAAVERSTGFKPPTGRDEELPERFRGLLDQCMACYERLHRQRLR